MNTCLQVAAAWGGVDRMKSIPLFLAAALWSVPSFLRADAYEIVVYGGTSGGITAAIQAVRMGKTAVLIEPTKHLGGLTTGGLGATDIGNKKAIGGISREFYQRVFRHYADPAKWSHGTREEYFSFRSRWRAGAPLRERCLSTRVTRAT